MANVRREQNAGDVRVVRLELADWHQRGHIVALDQTPYVDVALIVLGRILLKSEVKARIM